MRTSNKPSPSILPSLLLTWRSGRFSVRSDHWGHLPLDHAFPRAKRAALTALAIDEGFAAAHSLLGWVSWWYDWDLAACDRERRRALALAPSDVSGLILSGSFRLAEGGEATGIEEVELALRLDPLSQATNFVLAWTYLFAGDP